MQHVQAVVRLLPNLHEFWLHNGKPKVTRICAAPLPCGPETEPLQKNKPSSESLYLGEMNTLNRHKLHCQLHDHGLCSEEGTKCILDDDAVGLQWEPMLRATLQLRLSYHPHILIPICKGLGG